VVRKSRTPRRRESTSRVATTAVGLVVAVLTLTGCTASDRVSTLPRPVTSTVTSRISASPASTPPCTGADGRATLTAMLADLSRGKRVDVGTYFVPPIQFVRWVDPSAYVTFLPASDGSVTLDALQSHLNDLVRRHVSATLTMFSDGGYAGSALNNDVGGWFSFTVRGRSSATASPRDGLGKGAIDCTSKKIKVFVIDGW
jgi:hypothetical protein